MKSFLKLNLLVCFAAVISIASISATADPYIGVAVGTASYDVDLGTNGNFEEDGTGTKLFAGYNFNKYFAAEAAIYNFAEASIGAIETVPGSGDFIGAEADMKGVGAYAVGMYPVSKNVILMAKLGVLSWDADIRIDSTTEENDGTDVAYALAVSYAFTKELLATAEWESFDSDNPELSMLSVGFRVIIK